jgi:outer membrane biosynthesis protein TonB
MTTPEQLLERLQAAESAAVGPPAGTNERIWGVIEDRLANGPAPPELDDGPLLEHVPHELAANVGASSSVVLKVVGVLAVVGVIGGGLLALRSDRDRAPGSIAAAEPAPPEPASSEPAPPEPALPESVMPEPASPEPVMPEPASPEPAQPPPSGAGATSKIKTQPKVPAQPKSLADEVALMQALSTALKQEDSSKVLALVAEHERDFGKGQFIEERRAAKARALCWSGKLAAGQQEAESFAARWPNSIHLTFVNQACGLE